MDVTFQEDERFFLGALQETSPRGENEYTEEKSWNEFSSTSEFELIAPITPQPKTELVTALQPVKELVVALPLEKDKEKGLKFYERKKKNEAPLNQSIDQLSALVNPEVIF